MSSCYVEFEESTPDTYFVVTFAKVLRGKFVAYGPAMQGKLDGGKGQIEVLWAQLNGNWGYALSLPSGSTLFTQDDFFSDFQTSSRNTVKVFPPDEPSTLGDFRGFRVLGYAKGEVSFDERGNLIKKDAEGYGREYQLYLLFRETRDSKECNDVIDEIKNAKPE